MLLNELDINDLRPRKSTMDTATKFDRLTAANQRDSITKTGKAENLGAGMYATTHAWRSEPGTAIKTSNPVHRLEDDMYFNFVRMIASKKHIQDNPYFPRIYDVKVYKTRGDSETYVYQVKMERLHDLRNLDTPELLAIGRQMFTNFDDMVASFKHNKQFSSGVGTPKIRTNEFVLRKIILRTLDQSFSYNAQAATNIKDPNLKQAILIMKKMINSTDEMATDIHDGNIMVRRGPFTPQLVFTDPVV